MGTMTSYIGSYVSKRVTSSPPFDLRFVELRSMALA